MNWLIKKGGFAVCLGAKCRKIPDGEIRWFGIVIKFRPRNKRITIGLITHDGFINLCWSKSSA